MAHITISLKNAWNQVTTKWLASALAQDHALLFENFTWV